MAASFLLLSPQALTRTVTPDRARDPGLGPVTPRARPVGDRRSVAPGYGQTHGAQPRRQPGLPQRTRGRLLRELRETAVAPAWQHVAASRPVPPTGGTLRSFSGNDQARSRSDRLATPDRVVRTLPRCTHRLRRRLLGRRAQVAAVGAVTAAHLGHLLGASHADDRDRWRLGRAAEPDSSRAYVTDHQEGTLVTWDLDGSASYLPLTRKLPVSPT